MNPNEFAALRKTIDTSFGRIATYEMGSGPAALFVHGYPISAYHWRHQLTALADVRRCIAVDLLGLGYTQPAPGATVGYREQARMLLELADVLGRGAFDLVGNDSGARSRRSSVSAPDRIGPSPSPTARSPNNPPAALVRSSRSRARGRCWRCSGDRPRRRGGARGLATSFAKPETSITAERLATRSPRSRPEGGSASSTVPDRALARCDDGDRPRTPARRPVLVLWGTPTSTCGGLRALARGERSRCGAGGDRSRREAVFEEGPRS
jgi:pimeloyl-ACP methyl ester carboxylesterase